MKRVAPEKVSDDQVLDEAYKLANKERALIPQPVEETEHDSKPVGGKTPEIGEWGNRSRTAGVRENLAASGRAQAIREGKMENDRVIQLADDRDRQGAPARIKLDTQEAGLVNSDYQRLKKDDKSLNSSGL